MEDLNLSLTREKLTLSPGEGKTGIDASSNRILLELVNTKTKQVEERFVIRAQYMHFCLAFAARLRRMYEGSGVIMPRAGKLDWDHITDSLSSAYDKSYHEAQWLALYQAGNPIYKRGSYNPVFDLIEKYNLPGDEDYGAALQKAEDVLQAGGQAFKINHELHVAMVAQFEDRQARIALIQRSNNKTITFNFTTAPLENDDELDIPRCLNVAGAFLEGPNLAFLAGTITEQLKQGILEQGCPEQLQMRAAKKRIARLNSDIAALERGYKVRYRPERPDFEAIALEAERQVQRKSQI